MTNQTPDKSKQMLRYEMLQAFNARRKSSVLAMLLLVGAGAFGAHRFYLGQKAQAIGVCAFTALILILKFTVPEARWYWVLIAWGAMIFIEYFRLTNNVERQNETMRRELEDQYGLSTFS